MGLKVKDKIGICSENNINFPITFFASFFHGTTFCPFNPLYTEHEFLHVLNISKPKLIFVSNKILDKMTKIVKNLSWAPQLILLENVENSQISNLTNLITQISNDELEMFQLGKIDKNEHISIISCSSGTTGLPKGVMLTDRTILLMIQSQVEGPDPVIKNKMIVSGLLPLFHIYALDILLFTFAFNSTLVIFSKFEERSFLQAVEKYQIQIFCLVPTILIIFSTSSILCEFNVSSVKRLV